MLFTAICLLSVSPAAVSSTKSQIEDAMVELPFGAVLGNVLQASKEFLGIPYASPPERFAPARPWTSPYPGGRWGAKHFQAQCLQIDPTYGGLVRMMANFSEDCLYLNIYTPLRVSHHGLPVMVWIHPGGFSIGSANLPDYNASVLVARENVIVVAMNYRLGAFGFAATLPSGLNNGLRDQQEALRWVRTHIGMFGGDPGRVTLFGESSGGGSVSFHMWSPGSKGLFHNAIAQSPETYFALDAEPARSFMSNLSKRVGCVDAGNLTCLRKVDASQFLNVDLWTSIRIFKPTVDGDLMPHSPMELIRSGRFNRVPFTIGNTGAEADAYLPWGQSTPTTAKDMYKVMEGVFGVAATKRLTEIYTLMEGGIDNLPMLSEIMSDLMFWCNTRDWALALDAAGAAPWTYVFNRRSTPSCIYEDGQGFFAGPRAAHGTEIAYVFDNLPWLASNPAGAQIETNTSCIVPPEDRALGDKMADLWGSFARNGRMNASWPQFQGPAENSLMIDIATTHILDMKMGHNRGQCEAIKDLQLCEPGQCFLQGWDLLLAMQTFWAGQDGGKTLLAAPARTALARQTRLFGSILVILVVLLSIAGLSVLYRRCLPSHVEVSHYTGLRGA